MYYSITKAKLIHTSPAFYKAFRVAQLHLIIIGVSNLLSEGSCESPESPEPAALQEVKLLLRLVIFAGYHVLDDGLTSMF